MEENKNSSNDIIYILALNDLDSMKYQSQQFNKIQLQKPSNPTFINNLP